MITVTFPKRNKLLQKVFSTILVHENQNDLNEEQKVYISSITIPNNLDNHFVVIGNLLTDNMKDFLSHRTHLELN